MENHFVSRNTSLSSFTKVDNPACIFFDIL